MKRLDTSRVARAISTLVIMALLAGQLPAGICRMVIGGAGVELYSADTDAHAAHHHRAGGDADGEPIEHDESRADREACSMAATCVAPALVSSAPLKTALHTIESSPSTRALSVYVNPTLVALTPPPRA